MNSTVEDRVTQLENIVRLLIPIALNPKTNPFRCVFCGKALESVMRGRAVSPETICTNTDCPCEQLSAFMKL